MNPETAEVIQTFEHCFLWFQCTIIPQLAACVFTADLCPTLHRGLAEVSVAALQQLLGGLVACLVVALEQKTSRSTPPVCSSTLRLTVMVWNGFMQSLRNSVLHIMGQFWPFVKGKTSVGQCRQHDGCKSRTPGSLYRYVL